MILFLLFGVSAKHLSDEVSTTVSQNETTGSATLISVNSKNYLTFFLNYVMTVYLLLIYSSIIRALVSINALTKTREISLVYANEIQIAKTRNNQK